MRDAFGQILPARLAVVLLSGWVSLSSGAAAVRAAPEQPETETEDAAVFLLQDPEQSPFATAETVFQARKLRGLTGEAASLVLLAEPGGEISIEAFAAPLATDDDGKARVQVLVEIDGASFLDHNQARTARVEVYAYALGPNRAVAGYLAEAFAVDITTLGEAVWQSGLKFYGHLEAPPGDYTLRVLVRNFQSKAAALRQIPLSIPDRGTTHLLPPIFDGPAERDSWLPVREWDDGGELYPFLVGDRALSPAARPVIVAGRRQTAHLFGYGLPEGGVSGQMVLIGGQEKSQAAEIDVVHRETRGSLQILSVELDLPAVDAGPYRLQARLEAGGTTLTSEATNVFVLGRATQEREVLWTDLRWRLGQRQEEVAAQAVERSTAPPEQERSAKKRIKKLALGYREALAMLGSGSRSETLSKLLEYESSALSGNVRGGLDSLMAAELLTARELAEQDVEALIPVMTLHDELYQTYRQRRLFSLVAHTRSMIEQLAELYAKKGKSQGARVVAGRFLASLAGHLQINNLPASSRRLYLRALEQDPESRAALLGLAASFEKYGDYSSSLEYLELLTAAHPRMTEGLLRLAINLNRVGQRTRSAEVMARALELPGPSWVNALASEELARRALETGDIRRASEFLQASFDNGSAEPSTVHLLIHTNDRLRRRAEARELLSFVSAAPGRESARMLYDSWPESALMEARRLLTEAAEIRKTTLVGLLSEG